MHRNEEGRWVFSEEAEGEIFQIPHLPETAEQRGCLQEMVRRAFQWRVNQKSVEHHRRRGDHGFTRHFN